MRLSKNGMGIWKHIPRICQADRGQYGRAHGAEGGGPVTRRYARTEPAEAAMAS
eukprot:COSAG06_NODE_765_length_12475_cov_85.409502_10_plen_54_part_00